MNRVAICAFLVLAQISGTVLGARLLLKADDVSYMPVLEEVKVESVCTDEAKGLKCTFATPPEANECTVKFPTPGSTPVVTCTKYTGGLTFDTRFEIETPLHDDVSRCSVYPSGTEELAPIVICTPSDSVSPTVRDHYITLPQGFESCRVNFVDVPSMTCKKPAKKSGNVFKENKVFYVGSGEISTCEIQASKGKQPSVGCLGIPLMAIRQPKLWKGVVKVPQGAKICTVYGLDKGAGKRFVQCQPGRVMESFARDLEVNLPKKAVSRCDITMADNGVPKVDCEGLQKDAAKD